MQATRTRDYFHTDYDAAIERSAKFNQYGIDNRFFPIGSVGYIVRAEMTAAEAAEFPNI